MSSKNIIKALSSCSEIETIKEDSELIVITNKTIQYNNDVLALYIIKDLDEKYYMIDKSYILAGGYDNGKSTSQVEEIVAKNKLMIDGNMIVSEINTHNVVETLQRFINVAKEFYII